MAVAYPPGIKQSDLGIDPNLDLTLDPNPSYKNDFDFDFGAEWAKHVIYNNIKEIEDGVPEDVLVGLTILNKTLQYNIPS